MQQRLKLNKLNYAVKFKYEQLNKRKGKTHRRFTQMCRSFYGFFLFKRIEKDVELDVIMKKFWM